MRGTVLALTSLLATLASADPLGTRPSPAGFDASPVGVGPVVQLVLALALVGGALRFALPAIVKRFGGRLATEVGGSIRIEESAAFPGGRLYVVEARGRTLLLGATAQNVSCLADLTVTDFAEALSSAEGGVTSVETGATLPIPPSPLDRLARLERLGR